MRSLEYVFMLGHSQLLYLFTCQRQEMQLGCKKVVAKYDG